MTNLERYLRHHVTRFFAVFFIVLFLITNIVIITLNARYINRTNEEQNTSFIEMVEHLIVETSHDNALVFIEHYGHTHNVYLSYESVDAQYTHETLTPPSEDSNTYEVTVGTTVVGTMTIDNVDSTLTEGNTIFLVTVNGVLLLVFVLGLIILSLRIKKQHTLIMDDLKHVQLTIHQIHSESPYTFHDFSHIDTAFKDTLTRLEKAKASHKKHIQALAHDIKTPLTIIKASIEGVINNRLSLNDDLSNSILEEIETINTRVQTIMQDADNDAIEKRNVNEEITDTIEKFIPLFEQRKVELSYNIASEITIQSRPGAIARILDHLLQNILTHAKASKAHIFVTKEHIIVKDNGIGIDDDTLNTLTKGHSLNKPDASGYGLAIVKETLDHIHATWSIDSKKNQGTTITITFHS